MVDAFIRMRELISSNSELADKINELEKRVDTHDETIVELIQTLRLLTSPKAVNKPKIKIGFKS